LPGLAPSQRVIALAMGVQFALTGVSLFFADPS